MNTLKEAYRQKVEELLEVLASSKQGISQAEAKLRLRQYGNNAIETQTKENPLLLLLKQFKSPLIYLLVIAGGISLALGEEVDAIVISLAILLNVIVSFIQEYRASNALGALFSKTVLTTTVIREGKKHLIDAPDLVPGDVVDLKSGDKVPADGRLIEAKNLEVDESLLTGESFPRKKSSTDIIDKRVLAERDNMLFMGTNVVSGSALCLITQTGHDTELGEISRTIHEAPEEPTIIQKELADLARFLGIATVVIILIVFGIGLLRGHTFIEMFTESVALAVSALPEGLPAAVTVIFAIGMQKILKKNGLIRKLLATETLGRTEILCIDKTGTLTKGKMEIEQVILLDKKFNVKEMSISQDTLRELVTASTLCNTAFVEQDNGKQFRGKPTDVALLKLGDAFNITKESIQKTRTVYDTYPFNQNLKLSASLAEGKSNNTLYVCGAPEEIIKRCMSTRSFEKGNAEHFDKKEKSLMLQYNEQLGTKGYRILAVAYKNEDVSVKEIHPNFTDMTFLGLLVISDPLRKSAKETVHMAMNAGLRLILITGDHMTTARNVAKQVGLSCGEKNIIDGNTLHTLTDNELYDQIENICVYARVSPTDKVRIVNAWKKKDKIVAMTGDGINDAPALHLADIGIALGSGTDVAKESADMVLLNDNLKTILNAIEEGRRILDNIKKVVLYLLSDGLAEITLVAFAIILGWPLPILAAQILWVNLVEDGLPSIALALEPVEKDVLKKSPWIYKLPILDRELKVFTVIFGWVDDIALIGLFIFLYLTNQPIELIRTMVFATLTLDSLFFAFSCKSLRKPLWRINIFNNKTLNASFVLGVILLIGTIYLPPLQNLLSTVPLTLPQWAMLGTIAILDFATLELVKAFFIRSGFWRKK